MLLVLSRNASLRWDAEGTLVAQGARSAEAVPIDPASVAILAAFAAPVDPAVERYFSGKSIPQNVQ
jgi:hypothetical protein